MGCVVLSFPPVYVWYVYMYIYADRGEWTDSINIDGICVVRLDGVRG
jgi:hypothetical protein